MSGFDVLALVYYFGLGVLLIGVIWFVLDLEFNKNHLTNATPVKFKEFRKWYIVAPNQYLLMDTHAYRKDCNLTIIFNNPIDAIRYRSFAKKMKKNACLDKYMKYIKKDRGNTYNQNV